MNVRSVILALSLALPAIPPSLHAASPDEIQVRIYRYFLVRAKEGDMNSQYIVGTKLETGTGTDTNIDEAYSWYAKAAAQGHDLAKRKIETRNGVARRSEPAPEPARPAPRPAARPAPVVVAKAPAGAAVNIMDAVLSGTWLRNRGPAEYLPSARNHCLQTTATDIVCFSEEFTRPVGDKRVTFTTKATLTGFNDRDGSFTLNYLHNVIDIDSGNVVAAKDNPVDLRASEGWQQPGYSLDCRLNGERAVSCISADRKISLQFSKS